MLTEIYRYGKNLARRGLAAITVMASLFGVFPAPLWQQDGSPILIVENYVTDPSPVKSGEAFSLTVTVKNIGTKHADDVFATVDSASAFVGLGSPALVGKLEPQASGVVTLQVQAPEGLTSGAADIPLRLLYRIEESSGLEIVRTIGVKVQGGSGTAGTPEVVITGAEVLSPPAVVGDTFELELTLSNLGRRKAVNVTAALKINENVSPAEGSGTTQLSELEADATATFTLPLVLDQASATGRVLQTIQLEYRDSSGNRYTRDETIGLDLGSVGRQRPHLIVTEYETEPAYPAPGEPFVLTFRIANVGLGDARQVLLQLGDDDSSLAPFAPLGTSNVSFVAEVAANSTTTLSKEMILDGAAQGGAYALTVRLQYEDLNGEIQTESEVISLLALAKPQLHIILSDPPFDELYVGDSFEVPVEIINVGRQTVNVSTVEIVSDDLTLTEASLYVGALDAGTAGTLVAQATANQAGEAEASVVVHYLDEFNQEQALVETLSFTIVEASLDVTAVPEEIEEEATWLEKIWQSILGFLGLAG